MSFSVKSSKKNKLFSFQNHTPPTSSADIRSILYNHIINVEESYSIAKVAVIDISSRRCRINFYTSLDEELRLRVSGVLSTYDSNLPTLVLASTKDNQLLINLLPYEGLGYTNIENLTLDIYVPSNFNGDIIFSSICSPIEIHHLFSRNLTIDSVSSTIKVHNLTAEDISIKTISGDLLIDQSKGSLSIETISGDVNMNLGNDTQLKIKTITGHTKLYLKSPEIPVIRHQTITGKLQCKFSTTAMAAPPLHQRVELTSITGDFYII